MDTVKKSQNGQSEVGPKWTECFLRVFKMNRMKCVKEGPQ